MKLILAILAAAVSSNALVFKQDAPPPGCAGCTESAVQSYQICASKHGDPCAEVGSTGLVGAAPGTKKDVGCCMKKEKHDRCVRCATIDCGHKTCTVNKKYNNEHS